MNLYNKSIYESGKFSERISVIKEASHMLRSRIRYDNVLHDYIDSLQSDISRFFRYYFEFSQFQNGTTYPFTFNTFQDLTVKASIESVDSTTDSKITISLSLLMALDDLMNRICCNEDFMSFCPERDEKIWSGTMCYWPQPLQIPKVRFHNYNPGYDNPLGYTFNEELGKAYSGVPIDDDDRMYLANLLTFVGLTWIMFHEESHHWHGHLQYSYSQYGLFQLNETSNSLDLDWEDEFKTFEWQADRKATIDLFHLIFNVHDDIAIEMPDMFKLNNDLCWSVRTCVIAMSSVILMLQRSQLINNKDQFYPSNRTRFVTIVATVYEKIVETLNVNGSFCGVYNSEEVLSKVHLALLSALYDLLIVEDILVNDVNQSDDYERISYEPEAPKSLDFIQDESLIKEIIFGIINGCQHDSKEIDDRWFKEYRELSANNEILYKNVLKPYRKMVASPYYD